jgi:membrane protein DedA with SNARE-associated domain
VVLGITTGIFLIRDRAAELAYFGYPGIFAVALLANATLILPAPWLAVIFAMGAVFHPVGVAIAAGTGATLGELTGYLAGFSGQAVIPSGLTYDRLRGWTERHGGWAILVMAFIPSPLFDVAGMAAGALRMPVVKFLLWAWVGKTLKMLAFAYAGAGSVEWLTRLLEGGP